MAGASHPPRAGCSGASTPRPKRSSPPSPKATRWTSIAPWPRRAFEGPWRTMRAAERGNILLKWAELLKQHADEIIELESLDAGKPIAAVLRQDFPAAIDTLTYYAGW